VTCLVVRSRLGRHGPGMGGMTVRANLDSFEVVEIVHSIAKMVSLPPPKLEGNLIDRFRLKTRLQSAASTYSRCG